MKIPIEEYKRKSLRFTLNIPETSEIQLLMEVFKRQNKQIFVPYLLDIFIALSKHFCSLGNLL